MLTYICVFVGAVLAALVTTPIVILLGHRLRILDLPGPRKVHTKPIPRLGGIALREKSPRPTSLARQKCSMAAPPAPDQAPASRDACIRRACSGKHSIKSLKRDSAPA